MSEQPTTPGASPAAVGATSGTAEHLSPNRRAWQRFKRNRPAIISSWFLIGLIAVVIAWPVILKLGGAKFSLQFDPNTLNDEAFAPPNAAHWFGTDAHGRDLFSRILFGAQISLLVGAVGATVSLIIGVLWGAAAGYLGGRWDDFLMRIVDVLYSLPSVIFVIVLVTTTEPLLQKGLDAAHLESWHATARLFFLFVGLGAVSWLNMARIV